MDFLQNLRLRNLFQPNIPLESGFPGGTISMNPGGGIVQSPEDRVGWKDIFNPLNPIGNVIKTHPYGMNLGGDVGGSPSPQDDPNEILNQVNRLYQPQHEYSDMYMDALKNFPVRQKPSLARRIGAGIMGVGYGPEAGLAFRDEPYTQAVGDFTNRLKMIEPGMTEERYANSNQRMLLNEMVGRQIQDRRADIAAGESQRKKEADETRAKNEQDRIGISRQRAATADYKAKNPNKIMGVDEDGYVFGYDPQKNTAEYVLDENGDYISKLSDRDKINLGIGGRLSEIRAQNAGRQADIAARGAQARETEKVKAANKIDVKNNKDASGKVVSQTITITDAEGNITGTKTVKTETQPTKPTGTVNENASKIKMQTPDGRIIMVPLDKVAEARQRGAK